MQYLAVLGQNSRLSLAEILAVYPDAKIIAHRDEAVIFDTKKSVELNQLGGSPKIAEVIGEFSPDIKKISEAVASELFSFSKEQKVFFGLSFYGNANKNFYNSLGRMIKSRLTESGYRARWVVGRDIALSSVLIKTNKLLTRGADFCLVFFTGKIYLAKTAEVQDFSDYGFRDMRRPARDLVSGLTPPKLAKILINLGGKPACAGRQKEILDPFCGSGTFLGEAALLGFKKIYGSDVSAKAIADSKKNLEWLKEKYNFPADIGIKQCDIKNSRVCWSRQFDFIATEPYLGPPIRGTIGFEKAKHLQTELQKNYDEYLPALSGLLENGGTLVLIAPLIISENGHLKISLKLKENGLEAVHPLPANIHNQPTIIYSRQDQKIGREIYILKKISN